MIVRVVAGILKLKNIKWIFVIFLLWGLLYGTLKSPIVLADDQELWQAHIAPTKDKILKPFISEGIIFNESQKFYQDYFFIRASQLGLSFGAINKLFKIVWCESQWQQFGQDGNVLRGHYSPSDRGLFQINTNPKATEWFKDSKRLGLDLSSPMGNIEMGFYVLKTQGWNAWKNSKGCWTAPPKK